MRLLLALATAGAILLSPANAVHSGMAVALRRLPAGGIQPQVAVDAGGKVHVVYFTGDPANGDLQYSTLSDGGDFSPPIRVNSEAGSAIATGSVRGARLAVGRSGHVYVTWNGSGRAAPKAADGATPMLYTRLDPRTGTFEPQRNLLQFAVGLDGGGAIAADRSGRVFVAWHAGGPGARSEGDGRVWLAASADDGATFARERAVSDASTGSCGCCGMDGLIDRNGALRLLYRSARDVVHRDAYLLTSADGGQRFQSAKLEEWNIGACPMSTFALIDASDGVLAAWETDGQVQYATVGASGVSAVIRAPGSKRTRRHPALATNVRGETLLAWTEGTGWQRGGSVAWQVFDRAGRPSSVSGHADGVPVWGLVAAYARASGDFVIVY